ncbi:hypothetical protein [Aureimonas sp. SK2]|uniref:hypothetical protein n=1 Tax=Aureimonas sp. SK2 TaxID=3015992 RepID=UPI0024451F4C|nr:hypothetical protein [Aureimonas sp. SK2]
MKSDLIDLELHVHHQTDKAVLVSADGNRAAAVWLPLSAIEIAMRRGSSTHADVTLPQRLAEDKGLV